jgi:hypothetical protein
MANIDITAIIDERTQDAIETLVTLMDDLAALSCDHDLQRLGEALPGIAAAAMFRSEAVRHRIAGNIGSAQRAEVKSDEAIEKACHKLTEPG